jgi:2-methylisocitrate lyase-like PEP mutase family enzyme
MTLAEKRATFRALHADGCFVIPNPWDMGSARLLQHLGFKALASTSSGFAWTIGRPDYAVTLDDALAHLKALCAATDLPVSADFESGFAADPAGVARNVKLAIDAGVSGLSIEDRDMENPAQLYDTPLAVERIKAARAAIDQTGTGTILIARTEGLLHDKTALTPAIDRLTAFAAAGADCLFAPGVWGKNDIATMVRAVAPLPVNVLVRGPELNLAELAGLGVRRISVGGALARVAWKAVLETAQQIQGGDFTGLANGMAHGELNNIFSN